MEQFTRGAFHLALQITGSRDDIAPPDAIEGLLDELGPTAELATIQGADHFFSGYLQQLESAVSDAIKQ